MTAFAVAYEQLELCQGNQVMERGSKRQTLPMLGSFLSFCKELQVTESEFRVYTIGGQERLFCVCG